jgi:hypothetical protein
MNANSLRSSSGPRPKAINIESANIPRALPTTVATAVARPHEIARAIAKSTLGPGAKIMSADAIRYSGNLLGITISQLSTYFREK